MRAVRHPREACARRERLDERGKGKAVAGFRLAATALLTHFQMRLEARGNYYKIVIFGQLQFVMFLGRKTALWGPGTGPAITC